MSDLLSINDCTVGLRISSQNSNNSSNNKRNKDNSNKGNTKAVGVATQTEEEGEEVK